MLDILLPIPEECIDATSLNLITRYHIIWTEYRGLYRTKVTVYDILDYILGGLLGAYLM